MKFTKLSLVAALLAGSATFAIDNVKVSGDANVFYGTSDGRSTYTTLQNLQNFGQNGILTNDSGDLFSKNSSAADASVNLNVTADLFKNDMVTISAGAGYTVLTTLGLENNLVSQVWGSAHNARYNTGANFANMPGLAGLDPAGAKVSNANWATEAWIAATAGKTTVKLGRMELDTPLAFTETWSIEKNTFEAVVAINQDIPDTTLVGAYVGNGNGTETFGEALNANNATAVSGTGFSLAYAGVVNSNGAFSTYGTDGAYAIGAINNSFKPLTVQGWYYNVMNVAKAYWLQADLACQKIPGLLAGAQYTSMKADFAGSKSDDVYALMLGFDAKVATIKASYSSVNKDGSIGASGFNTATSSGASKLYTEAWWNYGYVTRANTDSYTLSVEGNVAGADLGAYYTQADTSADIVNAIAKNKMTEFTVTASKSYGPLDATLAYVYTKADDQNIDPVALAANPLTKGSAYNTIQAYLTVNF